MQVKKQSKKIIKNFLSFSKEHFWVYPALFFVSSIFAVNVNAQVLQASPSRANLFGIGDPAFYEAKDQCAVKPPEGQFGSILDAVQRLFGSGDATDFACAKLLEEQGVDPQAIREKFKDIYSPGLNDYVAVANAVVINERPASGTRYVEQQIYALSNPGQVSAQEPNFYYPGTGFSLQRPVQSFWGWSVNVTYGFLVLLIIIIAFAIMFRSKLGGSASITLQSAIPNIAIAMILVPLSYAISGLFIDGVTLGTNVAHEFLMGPGAPARDVYDENNVDDPNLVDIPIVGGIDVENRGLYADDVRVSWYGIWSSINVVDEIDAIIPGQSDEAPALIKLAIDVLDLFGRGESGLDTWIAEIINALVSVVIFFTGLRIFRLLVKKYITFLLNPIISPFIFATIAIPGTGTKNIMTFLKQLWSATLFFIVFYAMSLLSIILTSQSFLDSIPEASTSGYIPPGLGLIGLLAAGNDGPVNVMSIILTIAGIGIYLQIPKTLKDLDAKLGTDKSALMPIVNDTMTSWRQSVGTGRTFARAPGIISDSIDKARGKTPGDYGTLRGFARRGTSDFRQGLNNTAARGGLAGGAAKVISGGLGQASKLAGSNAAGSFEPGKDNVLKVGIKMGGADVGGGFLSLTDKQLLQLVNQAGGGGTSSVQIKFLFKITFEAENFRLPTRVTQVTVLNSVAKSSTTTEETAGGVAAVGNWDGLIPTRSRASARDMDIFNINKKSNGLVLFYPQETGPFTTNGKEFEIPMIMEVTNPSMLQNGGITFGTSIVADKRYFSVNGVTTKNNIRFALQSTAGND